METKENIRVIDSIVDALKKAAVDLEEFQVQMALGKAEAYNTYEDMKKKFRLLIHEGKFKLQEGQEKLEALDAKFDRLRVQLELGKAETVEEFRSQKKKLLMAIHDIEVKIKTNEKLKRLYAFLLIEIELFKVQLEILEEKFEKGKKRANVSFQKGKKEFNEFVARFKEKHSKKEEGKWDHFQDEISEAFTHFKKAFVSS